MGGRGRGDDGAAEPERGKLRMELVEAGLELHRADCEEEVHQGEGGEEGGDRGGDSISDF